MVSCLILKPVLISEQGKAKAVDSSVWFYIKELGLGIRFKMEINHYVNKCFSLLLLV